MTSPVQVKVPSPLLTDSRWKPIADSHSYNQGQNWYNVVFARILLILHKLPHI